MFAEREFLSQDPNTISSVASYVDTSSGIEAGLVLHDGHRIVKFSGSWEDITDEDFQAYLGEMQQLRSHVNAFVGQLEDGVEDQVHEELTVILNTETQVLEER